MRLSQYWSFVSAFLLMAVGTARIDPTYASGLQTGVIVLNPTAAGIAQQNATLSKLREAGVGIVRTGMDASNPRIDFAKRAFAQDIRIAALIEPQFPPDAIKSLKQSGNYAQIWGGLPLAAIDPAMSENFFRNFFQKLDDNGIVLAAVELGNEINWAGYPGKIADGRILDSNDLAADQLGTRVAAGYIRYLQILAELKSVRDHSRLNRRTPILSAGLSTVGLDSTFFSERGYAVTTNAALAFLRSKGLDSLVDAYAIHYYPRDPSPNARRARLLNTAAAQCRNPASGGKPCWVTEWGVENSDASCPSDESGRAPIVSETMQSFKLLAQQGRLVGALYYAWAAAPTNPRLETASIFRCGELTESGKLALQP